MSDVSILKIEVDDSEFQRFKAEFAKFQGDAAEMPEAWAATDEQIAKVRKNYEAMLKAAGAQSASADKTSESTKKTGASAVEWAKSWSVIYRGSRGLASSIAQSTLQLARWRGLTATFSGLIGAGGLFGLNTLAASAARRRSEALGIGSSYGERAAFAVNFGRIGNTDAILAGINAAATDVNKRQPLFSMGVDPTGKNPTQVFTELLPLVKKLVDRTDPSQLGNVIHSYGLDQLGIDTTTAMTIRGLRSSEINDLVRSNRADAKAFDVPDDIARRWTEFMTTIGKAETQIGATLARNLVNITPGLTHLSENVVKLFDEVTKDPRLAAGLKKVGDTLTEWAEMIGADGVQDRIKRYVKKFDATKRDFDQINKWMNAHAGTLKEALGAVLGARIGAVLGPAGMAAGAVIGGFIGGRGLITGDRERAKAYERQRAGGAADERDRAGPQPTPEQMKKWLSGAKPEDIISTDTAGLAARAVDIASTKEGEHEVVNRADIEEYLRTGGRGMDPAKIPWCAAFVGASLHKAGLANSGSDMASSYAHWGSAVATADAKRGDVMMEGSDLHHVGMATGRHRPGETEMISGNYGDAVHTRWFRDNNMTTRRATDKERLYIYKPSELKKPTAPSTAARPHGPGRRGMAAHMAPPSPHVEIHDNTGGASHVDVTPAAPALTPAQMAYRAQLEKQFPLIKNGPAPR